MKTLLAVILAATFSLVASAQQATTATLSRRDASASTESFGWGPPPSVCSHCLFYGGDVNPSDPNVMGFSNGSTLIQAFTQVYGAVTVPATGHYVITGVFFQTSVTGTGKVFDPPTAFYDIRINLSEGSPGTSVSSGWVPQTAIPTGRFPFGYEEFSTIVNLPTPLTAVNGTTYWISESPQCTNSSNPACREEFYVDNTTQKTGAINGSAQPTGQSFFGASLNWANLCDTSNPQQCADLSFGVLGRSSPN